MKKIILIALLPAFLLSCQSHAKKNENAKSSEKTKKEEKDPTADIKATTLIKEGQNVPEFTFKTLDGDQYSMKELKGKVVLLNFFATWCPTCNKELPELQKQVWEKYKNNDNFYMVSIGRDQKKEKLEEFKEKKGYSFNFAADTGKVIYNQFAEKYIPRNVIVGKDGVIKYQGTGYTPEEFSKILKIIDKELKK